MPCLCILYHACLQSDLARRRKNLRAHCTQIIHYTDTINGKPDSKKIKELADLSDSRFEVVQGTVQIGEENDFLYFQMKWNGLPDGRDWTYHPIQDFNENIPELVISFLQTGPQKALAKKIRYQLFWELHLD